MGKLGKIAATGFTVLTIVGCGLAIVKRRDIADWARLRNYEPPATIVALSERTTMSDEGKHLFYVYHPQLLDKVGFNQNCDIYEKSIVLGCYDSRNIFLYDISDSQLDGVEEVTSAHEMLHAAYDRLSNDEKKRINALLEETLSNSSNERIKKLVESYRQLNSETVQNEMHSIVGTEMREIPEELEEYYTRYFLNRHRVVEYSEKYEEVFVNLENKVEQLDSDLLLRKSEINRRESALENDYESLQMQKGRLDDYKANNDIARYNAEVGGYNQAVNAYNAEIQEIRSLTEEYNQKVEERNSLALQQNHLIKNLDSKTEEYDD